MEFFESGVLTTGMNDAMLVLIPKVLKPEKNYAIPPHQFMQTKAMVLRLNNLMPKLVGPAQASFIIGRLSIVNIVVVQEAPVWNYARC